MAHATTSTTSSTTPRSPRGTRGTRGTRWMTDRQLDVYLQTKEFLRRMRAAAALARPTARQSPSRQTA